MGDKTLLHEGFEACARGLREFGYNGITSEKIEMAHEHWRNGEEAADVIEMFAFRDFDDRPQIFGRKIDG